MSVLLEGGRAVEGVSPISLQMYEPTLKRLVEAFAPFRITREDLFPLGSTGKKQTMGDLDFAVYPDKFGVSLTKFAENPGKWTRVIADTISKHVRVPVKTSFGENVHFAFPIYSKGSTILRDENGEKYVEVDLFLGDLVWTEMFHSYYGDSSRSKFTNKMRNNVLLAIVGSSVKQTDNPEMRERYSLDPNIGLRLKTQVAKPSGKWDTIQIERVDVGPNDLLPTVLGIEHFSQPEDTETVEGLFDVFVPYLAQLPKEQAAKRIRDFKEHLASSTGAARLGIEMGTVLDYLDERMLSEGVVVEAIQGIVDEAEECGIGGVSKLYHITEALRVRGLDTFTWYPSIFSEVNKRLGIVKEVAEPDKEGSTDGSTDGSTEGSTETEKPEKESNLDPSIIHPDILDRMKKAVGEDIEGKVPKDEKYPSIRHASAVFEDEDERKTVSEILDTEDLIIEEKLDGMQFGIMKDSKGHVKYRSKNQFITPAMLTWGVWGELVDRLEKLAAQTKNFSFLPNGSQVVGEFVPREQTNRMMYDAVPTGQLSVFELRYNQKYQPIEKVIEAAKNLQSDGPNILFRGTLNDQQKEILKRFFMLQPEERPQMYEGKTFTQFIMSVINPSVEPKSKWGPELEGIILKRYEEGSTEVKTIKVVDPKFTEQLLEHGDDVALGGSDSVYLKAFLSFVTPARIDKAEAEYKNELLPAMVEKATGMEGATPEKIDRLLTDSGDKFELFVELIFNDIVKEEEKTIGSWFAQKFGNGKPEELLAAQSGVNKKYVRLQTTLSNIDKFAWTEGFFNYLSGALKKEPKRLVATAKGKRTKAINRKLRQTGVEVGKPSKPMKESLLYEDYLATSPEGAALVYPDIEDITALASLLMDLESALVKFASEPELKEGWSKEEVTKSLATLVGYETNAASEITAFFAVTEGQKEADEFASRYGNLMVQLGAIEVALEKRIAKDRLNIVMQNALTETRALLGMIRFVTEVIEDAEEDKEIADMKNATSGVIGQV